MHDASVATAYCAISWEGSPCGVRGPEGPNGDKAAAGGGWLWLASGRTGLACRRQVPELSAHSVDVELATLFADTDKAVEDSTHRRVPRPARPPGLRVASSRAPLREFVVSKRYGVAGGASALARYRQSMPGGIAKSTPARAPRYRSMASPGAALMSHFNNSERGSARHASVTPHEAMGHGRVQEAAPSSIIRVVGYTSGTPAAAAGS